MPSPAKSLRTARRRLQIAWLSLLGVGLALPAGADLLATARTVALDLGFSEAEFDRVLAGEIVTVDRQPALGNEVSLAVGATFPNSLERVIEFVRSWEIIGVDDALLQNGPIVPGREAASLAAVPLSEEDAASLRDARPGMEWNLSEAEIARLAEAPETGKRDAFRGIMADRAATYWKRGPAGMEPFARPGASTRPDRELARLIETDESLFAELPELREALRVAPVDVRDVEQEHWWVLQQMQGNPVPILEHHLLEIEPDAAVLLIRQHYVARSYNVGVLAVAMFELEDRSLMLYSIRLATDQLSGIKGKAGRPIARRIQSGAVRKSIEQYREKLEAESR